MTTHQSPDGTTPTTDGTAASRNSRLTNEPHHGPVPIQQEAPAADLGAASCRVRSPYPASAPGVAEVSGTVGAPGSAGPGEPTVGGATEPSPSAPQPPTPRRRLREHQLRERRVHPRYSDGEFADPARAAGASGMQVGGYVAEASLAAARADDPAAAVADYRAAVRVLMAANGQLGKVGSNLNQLARHLNQDGALPEREAVRRLLDRVEASIAELDTAIAQVTAGR